MQEEPEINKPRRFIYNESEHKQAKRNKERLKQLKGLVEQAHRITRQIKIK